MNKVTLALAATTAGLTLLSIHLWRQLDAERERSQAAAMQRAELQVRLEQLEQERHSTPALDTTPTAPAATSVAQSTPVTSQRAAAGSSDIDPADLFNVQHQKRWEAARRRMLEDPRERELLKARALNKARDENSDLARELQLTDAEFVRLIELLAQYELQVATVFMSPDTMDDPFNDVEALRAQLSEDITTLLGYEKAQQYAAFDDSRQVRTQVRRLRGRLSEGDALTDEQNQRLIATLQEQRVKHNEEMKRRVPKERVGGSMTTWDGAHAIADRSSKLPMREQFMKQLEEFRERQKQGAAAVLNSRQLRVFERLQDEQLIEERVDARTSTLADQSD